jgi:hypothetical protein
MRRSKIVLISILFLLSCFKDKEQRGVSYYKDGTLKHEVRLINGEPEGLGIVYFENGQVQSKTDWKDGKKHGKSIIYYKNGNVRQENEYRDDLCLASKDYTEDGYLEEIRTYDSLGRVIDYYNYNKDGSRNFNRETKDPIFIREKDTISVGETYIANIRLGNRQYDNIEVIIGDISDPYIAKKNPPLPKKDSLTSILNIKADSAGLHKISGIVIERSATSDSLDVIQFTHRFYVKD